MVEHPYRNTYIFGGTFDPVHEGHVGVIREVLAPGKRLLVLAPTSKNPWKEDAPTALALRVAMLRLVLSAEGIPISEQAPEEGLCISDFEYSYVKNFIDHWRERWSGPIHWVVGPDIAGQAKTWKDWDKLDISLYAAKTYAGNLHATEVRAGAREAHPAIREFVRNLGLYEHPK